MAKSFLYRLFGLGKIPARVLPVIELEGIVLLEEGISGSITFRKFRAPGRYYGWRWSWFTGSLVLTQKRFAAYTFYPFLNSIIDVPLDDERINELHCSVKDEATLCVRFDPAAFHEGWSGSIEVRFSTPQARLFLEGLEKKQVGRVKCTDG